MARWRQWYTSNPFLVRMYTSTDFQSPNRSLPSRQYLHPQHKRTCMARSSSWRSIHFFSSSPRDFDDASMSGTVPPAFLRAAARLSARHFSSCHLPYPKTARESICEMICSNRQGDRAINRLPHKPGTRGPDLRTSQARPCTSQSSHVQT
jgi:hypothetical protein